MAKITVTADPTTGPATPEHVPVLLEESVYAVHLSTDHAAHQLIERLVWALDDAEQLERARPERRPT